MSVDLAKRFAMEDMETAFNRKKQENRRSKVNRGGGNLALVLLPVPPPPEDDSLWTMQAIADELIPMEVVDYITDSTICEVMKKRNQTVACKRTVYFAC